MLSLERKSKYRSSKYWRHDFFPAYFSVMFSMFCIEQAKIYREPKFGSDSAFDGWTIYREVKMSNFPPINTGRHVGVPLWNTNMAAKKLRLK